MSMHNFPVNTYGLVFTEEEVKEFFGEKFHKEEGFSLDDYTADECVDMLNQLFPERWFTAITEEYEGEWDSLGTNKPLLVDDSDSYIVAETKGGKTLFGTALYNSVEDLIEEYRKDFAEYLPEDFDIAGHLGEYWGVVYS